MPKAVRMGVDLCTGSCSKPPRQATTGSSNVFINGCKAVRVSDLWAPHPHIGTQVSGSKSVLINGLPEARVGDDIDCGSHNRDGSSNVIKG